MPSRAIRTAVSHVVAVFYHAENDDDVSWNEFWIVVRLQNENWMLRAGSSDVGSTN